MGYQVIKQPDGKLAVFCSYTDQIIMVRADKAEVMEWARELEMLGLERQMDTWGCIVDNVLADQPRDAYFQFAMTWDEALKIHDQHAVDGEGRWWETGVEEMDP